MKSTKESCASSLRSPKTKYAPTATEALRDGPPPILACFYASGALGCTAKWAPTYPRCDPLVWTHGPRNKLRRSRRGATHGPRKSLKRPCRRISRGRIQTQTRRQWRGSFGTSMKEGCISQRSLREARSAARLPQLTRMKLCTIHPPTIHHRKHHEIFNRNRNSTKNHNTAEVALPCCLETADRMRRDQE